MTLWLRRLVRVLVAAGALGVALPARGQDATPAASPEGAGELAGAEAWETDATDAAKLNIYGFSDFTFWYPLMKADNPWRRVLKSQPSFFVGNLNTYFDSSLTDRWRALAEVRFLFAPHGTTVDQDDGTVVRIDNTVEDNAEFGNQVRWGGVVIERASVEYAVAEWLTVRAGLWLTPYGIWNVDHGAPAIIGIRRPFTVRQQPFPERQSGIEILGARDLGAAEVGYHLTLSNGRGPADSSYDLDANKALGGRAWVRLRAVGELIAGVSFYRGRFTSTRERWTTNAAGHAYLEREPLIQYDEQALAGDLRWRKGGWHAQGEAMWNERRFVNPYRPAQSAATPGMFVPDGARWGGYGLGGYRLAWHGVMPYLGVEYFRFAPGDLPGQVGYLPYGFGVTAGVNVRPVPTVVLKVEFIRATFPEAATGWGDRPLQGASAQVAWAF